jgi:hypothetical protein
MNLKDLGIRVSAEFSKPARHCHAVRAIRRSVNVPSNDLLNFGSLKILTEEHFSSAAVEAFVA